MRQLTLSLRPEAQSRLDNFVVGDNAQLLDALRVQAALGQPQAIYLWGESGSGRSHLLAASAAESRHGGRESACANGPGADGDFPLPPDGLLCVDDVQALDETGQAALFRAFIRAQPLGTALLLAGARPPAELAVREDVRTRIGQCLVFELKALDDQQKEDVLVMYGLSRGLMLDPDLVQYLLRHGQRDLPSLLAAVDALDERSLALHRMPTLPLLREVLQTQAAPLETETQTR
ncbi:DnaA regulatory inactivator Hda [Niveibacterium sp. SC-1]|uniref:DnaA regulatory inactivator Hda n=1 Tax=Niveibacterium sp. SC-1 TaxID=3135646 RepID=UPI00311DC6FE